MTKHFTKITDLSKEELEEVLNLSEKIELDRKTYTQVLSDKNILFCFEKPSLRTLIGTESGINQLGASVIHSTPDVFLGGNIMYVKNTKSFGERELTKDTVKNIQEFCDAIFVRVFSHQTIQELSKISDIPVVNALCDKHHPMQALADLLTIREISGKNNKEVHISFIGDANNVAFSLFQFTLILGYKCSWCGPQKHHFSSEAIRSLQKLSRTYGGKISFEHDPLETAKKSDFIYTDTFISMGEEYNYETKIQAFSKYQVNQNLWKNTNSDTKFMHCLPAHRNIEVMDEIIDGPQSIVYQQAKNRMVTAKGLFTFLLS